MTQLLKDAFDQANKLDPAEQEILARWLLDELASERRWRDLLVGSQDELSHLAAEALAEHRAGQTLPLNPDDL